LARPSAAGAVRTPLEIAAPRRAAPPPDTPVHGGAVAGARSPG